MLLAIDVGNTQTVIGLFGDPEDPDREPVRSRCEAGLLDHWRIATVADRTADEQALAIQEFLGFHGFSFDEEVDGLVISSVVPRCTAAFREMTEKYFGFDPVVIEPGIKTGLPVLTENPREVGADRIANAVAAVDVYGGPALVIDFGTATTYDAVSEKGEYLGCAIAPGIDISLDALYQRADALRRVELVEPRKRDRPFDGGGLAVGRGVRFRRAGRRHRRSHARRHRRRGGRRHRRARRDDRPLHARRSSTSSRGSRCTACA